MKVRIFTIEDDGQAHDRGSLVLRDGRVVTDPVNDTFPGHVRDTELFINDQVFRADREPEMFLRNLHRQYTGSRLRATKVESDGYS